jgi:hypothetical protein
MCVVVVSSRCYVFFLPLCAWNLGGRVAVRMMSGNNFLLSNRFNFAYNRYKEAQELLLRPDPTLCFLMGLSMLLHTTEGGVEPVHDTIRGAFGKLSA